jgi:hypothetical protein
MNRHHPRRRCGFNLSRRSTPARPNICRFSILIRFTCPSTAPELNGNVNPAVTAPRSDLIPTTNDCSLF